MEKFRVNIHVDVLKADREQLAASGQDTSEYDKALGHMHRLGGYPVSYTTTPEELARELAGEKHVVLSGGYGDEGSCIDQYSQALIDSGIKVTRDKRGIVK